MTRNLTLNEIAERFQVSTASVHHVTSSKYKEVHESRRHFSGRKKKLTPEHEALILRTIFFAAPDGADRNSSCD